MPQRVLFRRLPCILVKKGQTSIHLRPPETALVQGRSRRKFSWRHWHRQKDGCYVKRSSRDLCELAGFSGSKILNMMQMSQGGAPTVPPPALHLPNHRFNDMLSDVTPLPLHKHQQQQQQQQQQHSNNLPPHPQQQVSRAPDQSQL